MSPLGRLVETPEDIIASISTFLTNERARSTRPPRTSALVTGSDFMTDGAHGVADALDANGKTVDPLINDRWTGVRPHRASCSAEPRPASSSFNGHFDQTHMLTGDGNDLVQECTARRPREPGKLARRCSSAWGATPVCRSPTSRSAPSSTGRKRSRGAKQGGLYAANTGFGYGDDRRVALVRAVRSWPVRAGAGR